MLPGKVTQDRGLAVGDLRQFDLDWVRIAAFGLLILYHVGMLYVSWGFHIKSDHRLTGLEPWMLVLNPWRLALLFLVSGAATAFMLRKQPAGRLVRSRTLRLLPPLLFGMLVIVPPQAYVQVIEAVGYDGSLLDFYRQHYFAFGPQFCQGGPCLLLPTWNQLWFVAYLWIYTLVLGAVLWAAPGLVRRVEAAVVRLLSSSVMLLAIPAAIFAACRLVLLPRFPSTHALFGDWYNHAIYGAVFLMGFLVARADGVWSAMLRLRWVALMLAVALFGSFLVFRGWQAGAAAPLALRLYGGVAYGGYQWCCIVAVLGFARRWLSFDAPARRYLTEAVFPYYMVHQTAIILVAHGLKGAGLLSWQEAAIVIGGTALACAASYEIVRRIALLRPLFGLRPAAARVEPRSLATAEG